MKPIILYVDDENANLFLFKITLRNEYNVLTAESGKEGIDILNSNKNINVVFSDMKMPHMSGIEFIKNAKNKYPHIKYFILTAFNINEEIQKALDDGIIYKYLSKPFDMKSIRKNINDILNSNN